MSNNTPTTPAQPQGVSIIIPTYNGIRLLEENLPFLLEALDEWAGAYEVIVVDDCSIDDTARMLKERFPQIKLLQNYRNEGFSHTCNNGMQQALYPVAICLNNDVKVTSGFVSPLLAHFGDPSVFAVTPNILAERDGRNQGIVYGLYGKGFIKGGFAAFAERSCVRENLYAIGACVAYNIAMFRSLGGYAEIYTPYLFEDVDISYRAWKRGWRNIYEPGATVYHYSSATIGKTNKRHKRTIYFRNRFLFHWINLTDPSFIAKNAVHTLLRLTVCFLWLDFSYYAAFLGALRRVRAVAKMRRTVRESLKLSDQNILQRTRKVLSFETEECFS